MQIAAHRAVPLAGAILLLGGFCAPRADAATAVAKAAKLSGRILGVVTDAAGVPQMGANVALFDRSERLRLRVNTDEQGRFAFDNLSLGAYAVRVSLAAFVPVLRSNILVQPGGTNFLNVSMAGLFSTITLVYPSADRRALMSDEWKWVLRSSSETRPVLRFAPGIGPSITHRTTTGHAMFTDTRGMLKVSAGEGGRLTNFGTETDLGTAFALATSVFGRSQVEVAGNFGYATGTQLPTAGFRTTYSRGGNSPEVSLTMRQLFAPGRTLDALGGGPASFGVPVLRTMSLSFDDSTQVSDSLRVDYGFSLDSVTFYDRLNYASPYARARYSVTQKDSLEFGYSSGVPRPVPVLGGPAGKEGAADVTLQDELTALAMFPRVSLRDGRARVQRRDNFELGYTKVMGSRTVRAIAYHETITNAGLMMSSGAGFEQSGDVLPDLFSNGSVFNAGTFRSAGYMLSGTQNFGENLSATLTYSSGNALLPTEGAPPATTSQLRSRIHSGIRRAGTAQMAGTLPWTGTHFFASYQWTDRRSATPTHYFMTQGIRNDAGLNFYVRQPVPQLPLLPARMEISADMRNLLSQGYLPFSTADGKAFVMMHTPRSVRGGLSFIF